MPVKKLGWMVRAGFWIALSALASFSWGVPRASPWAVIGRAVGAWSGWQVFGVRDAGRAVVGELQRTEP